MKDNKALKYLTLITGVLTLLLGVYTLVRPMRTFLPSDGSWESFCL